MQAKRVDVFIAVLGLCQKVTMLYFL